MPRFLFVSLALFLAAPAVEAAAPPAAIRRSLDIRYHPGKDRHLLDVFAPALSGKADPARRYPVVLFVHGGTWIKGDKDHGGRIRAVGQSLARQGTVAVLINYRLSPGVRHPEHVKDVARAFAWVRKNIAGQGGDPDRIVIAGHSAGGHLATLLVADECYLGDPALALDADARKAIRAVVSLSGVYRVPQPEEFRAMSSDIIDNLVGEDGTPGVKSLMRPALFAFSKGVNPFRMVFGSDPEVCKKASPITHARKGLPPMLLLQAESEVPGLRAMTADFAKALRKQGNVVEVAEIEDTTHRTIHYELRRRDSEASKIVRDFITRHVPAGKP
jgi:acetyl esterase/lipase